MTLQVGQGGRNFAQNEVTKEGSPVIPKLRVDVSCLQALAPQLIHVANMLAPRAKSKKSGGPTGTMENTAFLRAGKVTAVTVKHAQGSLLTKKY